MGVDAPVGGNSLAIGVGVGHDMTSNIGFEGDSAISSTSSTTRLDGP